MAEVEEVQQAPKSLATRILDPNKIRNSLMFLGGVAVAVLIVGIFVDGGHFISQLKDNEVSRGLITFLVASTTVLLAIILTLFAITSEDNEAVKERFSLGKEVLSTLVGILGTVLGFYFGSADKSSIPPLTIADVNFRGQQLMTHVSGGTPPYRYSITPASGAFSRIEGRISKDGWILETVDKMPPAGTAIVVYVSDAKDKTVSLGSNFPSDQGSDKASTPKSTEAMTPATPQATRP